MPEEATRARTLTFPRKSNDEIQVQSEDTIEVTLERGDGVPEAWLSADGKTVVVQRRGLYFLQAKTTFNQLDDNARARTQIVVRRDSENEDVLRVASHVWRSGRTMHPSTVGMVELLPNDRVQLLVDYDGPNFVRFANPTSLTLIRL